jgi:hypothetical protein
MRDLKTFDPYRQYISKQDESQKVLQDVLRKYPGFVSFIEVSLVCIRDHSVNLSQSTKYQTTGIGNIGIRELLMEPVQRIPRYTLLWQSKLTRTWSIRADRALSYDQMHVSTLFAARKTGRIGRHRLENSKE